MIFTIRTDGPNPLVGLYSDVRLDNWSDLDGEVSSRKGWWLSARELARVIEEADNSAFEVSKPLEHRGVQLKGKVCRKLANMEDGSIFVEFEEDVNGCSADGLGKAGYCVAIKNSVLKPAKKKEKHAK